MRVPKSAVDGFAKDLDALARRASGYIANRILAAIAGRNPTAADVVSAAREALDEALAGYGDAAAAAGADYFDEFMEALGIDARGMVHDVIDIDEVMSRLWPMAQEYVETRLEENGWGGFAEDAADLGGYLVKRAGRENVARNCEDNGIAYARVPSGAHTCDFCLMLASRGFVYYDAQAAGEGRAFHRGCDCRIVPGTPGTQVEGYDPDALYRRWKGEEKRSGTKVEDIGTYPKRPRRSDYTSDSEYEAARDAYRDARREFGSLKEKLVDELSSQPGHGYGTRDAASAWAGARGVRISDEVLEAADPRLLDEIVHVNDSLMSKYPEVLESYSRAGSKYEVYVAERGLGYFMEANDGLGLNPAFMGSYREAVEMTVDMYTESEMNEFVGRELTLTVRGDGTFRTPLAHEFGHNVDTALRDRFYDGEELVDEAGLRRYESELMQLTRRHSTSEYSMSNVYEAFAEGFAEMECNPTSKYAKEFGAFFRRWR